MFTSKEILDIAVKIEQNGEAAYRQALQVLTRPGLAERLAWMADEEARHATWFREMQSALLDQRDCFDVDEMNRGTMSDLVGDQTFTLQDVDFSGIKDMQRLLDTFIEFEKDSILFFELLRTFIKDQDVLEDLDRIIAEEYQHIETLQEIKP